MRNRPVRVVKVPANSTRVLIRIKEPGIERIIDLNSICGVIKFDDSTLQVYLQNHDDPWLFKYGAAECLWQILTKGSEIVYQSPELENDCNTPQENAQT